MNIIHTIQKIGWKFGIDIKKFNPGLNIDYVHAQLLKKQSIDLVLDVGANVGQFGKRLRENYEYKGNVISFEPMNSAREQLIVNAAKDSRWKVLDYALGDVSGMQMLNVSGNSQSSSILPMHHNHEEAAPESRYVGQQAISVKRLDDVFSDLDTIGKSIFLKLDVQGYEMRVLRGALESMDRIRAVRLEMSVRPLYEGEILIDELISYMRGLNFHLVAMEPNFTELGTGFLLQVDGLFCRM